MAQKKDTAVSISSRREMSVLLSQSREASARIRVENIIQTDICVELMEILELYAELLLARAGLLDMKEKDKSIGTAGAGETTGWTDTGLEEAAASIIYAAPRLPREVRELGLVRGLLIERFGKEFALKCGVDGGGGLVPKRVVDKLRVEPPGEELVEAYLTEIARTYGIEWPKRREGNDKEEDEEEKGELEREEREMTVLQGEVDDEIREHDQKNAGDGSGHRERDKFTAAALSAPFPRAKTTDLGRPFERPELARATPPRGLPPKGAKSPISVAPPAPRSDNPSPQLKLPDDGPAAHQEQPRSNKPAAAAMPSPSPLAAKGRKNPAADKIPDVDELAKRFSQLKR